MGCMRSQFKYIDTDGNKQIDMKRVSQYKNTRAQLLSPTTGLNHRLEQSSYHRTQRKDNQRKPKPDLVNLASPMSSPRLITSPNDNRHRRAGAMLLRRLRSLCNKIAADKQGKAFGILETGRGFGEVLSSMAILAVFGILGSSTFALSMVIVQFSVLILGLGIVAWFTIDDAAGGHNIAEDQPEVGIKQILFVFMLRRHCTWV